VDRRGGNLLQPHPLATGGCGQDGGRLAAILTAAPRRRRGFFWQRRAFSQSWSAPISPTSAAASASTASVRAWPRRPVARSWSGAAARAGLASRR